MIPRVIAWSFFLLMGLSAVFAEGFSISSRHKGRNFLSSARQNQNQQRRDSNSFNIVLPDQRATSTKSNSVLYSPRGGVRYADPSDDEKSPSAGFIAKTVSTFGSVWGSLGVVYILAKAITRVLPIALEPFKAGSTLVFSPFHWSMYAITCAFFAYAEGYKGFQLKFSPLVVKRSSTLVVGTRQGNNPLNYLLAPLYSMGLIHATKKRLVISWSVSMGVAMIVALVKRLPPISRCILDAGVVVGLTWGSLSILFYYIKSMVTGKDPPVDACLP